MLLKNSVFKKMYKIRKKNTDKFMKMSIKNKKQ